ncbi:hypothetical protein PG984_016007 [Apiospora sp. TS-2023a]
MATTKEQLLACAESIATKYDLNAADILSFANGFSHGMKGWTLPPFPAHDFENLLGSLTDIKQQIPEWLGTREDVVMRFSTYQAELVILLIETRFWHGLLTKHFDNIWHWNVVFGSDWPVHRQAVSEELITGFVQVYEEERDKLLPWADLISEHYEEDIGPVAEALRKRYFPAGIDDARVGFAKHYKVTKDASRTLEKKCSLVKKHIVSNSSLLDACKERLHETSERLHSLQKVSKTWGKNTRAQKEWWQLPGNSCGLTYGWTTRVDLSNTTYELCLPGDDGKSPWRTYCNHQAPVYLEKGSSWRQFLGNQAQPDLAAIRRYRVEENTEDPEEEEEGPLEIRLPQAIYPILNKHLLNYRAAKRSVVKLQHSTYGTVPELHSKELSKWSGEDYWMVRDMKFWTTQVDYQVYNHGIMKGRPRYDAAHNLRLDYFNGVLKDLRSDGYIKDNRSNQSCVVMKSVDGE